MLSFHLYFCSSLFIITTAEINDMKICYVLLDGSNATSDIFYFTVEDNGKNPKSFYLRAANNIQVLLSVSRNCLHHKDLEQLAMTDTRDTVPPLLAAVERVAGSKDRGQRRPKASSYCGFVKVKDSHLLQCP